jgi:hypothetical protein
VLRQGPAQGRLVQRLDEASVEHADPQPALRQQVGRTQRLGHQRAVGDQHGVRPGPHGDGFAQLEGGGWACGAGRLIAGVAEGNRPRLAEGKTQALRQLGRVGRGAHNQVGPEAQVGDVGQAVMGGPIGAHQAAAVQGKDDGQVLQRHLVEDLVECPLQEGGVNGGHGAEAGPSGAGGEGHRVLLADADVEKALGKAAAEGLQAGALWHGGGDGDDARIVLGRRADRRAEHLGERGARRPGGPGCHLTRAHLKRCQGVKAARIGVGHLEATALLGVDVQHDRLLAVAQLLQDADELAQVMAVVRTNIIQPERREEGGGGAGRERALL